MTSHEEELRIQEIERCANHILENIQHQQYWNAIYETNHIERLLLELFDSKLKA